MISKENYEKRTRIQEEHFLHYLDDTEKSTNNIRLWAKANNICKSWERTKKVLYSLEKQNKVIRTKVLFMEFWKRK